MDLSRPSALLLVLLAPALLAGHLLLQRRRRRSALRVSSVALVRAALPPRSRWRRQVPLAALLGAVGLLGVAAAEPTRTVDVPLSRTTILLALDVSRSMCATDVEPNRLTAAQAAAKAFVRAQDDGTRIGIVAFAGFASVVVPPTTDDGTLEEAIDALTTSRGTAIGMAILAAVDAIAASNPAVAPTSASGAGTEPPAGAAPTGDFVPDVIVVLTDGANSQGVDPVLAAQQAADRRVRVYTIGFGTTEPSGAACTVEQLGADAFDDGNGFGGFGGGGFGGGGGGGFGGGGGAPRRLLEIDEPTLQAVADTTGGTYARAEDADQLSSAFRDLPRQIAVAHEERELSVWFAFGGASLALAAVALSLHWQRT